MPGKERRKVMNQRNITKVISEAVAVRYHTFVHPQLLQTNAMDIIITVSIVEDMDEIRARLKSIVEESAEFACMAVYNNAEDALKELPVSRPDIVLMDINLPGMTGIECIRKVKVLCPEILFMMFTIYEDSEQVFEALAAGASGYLLKKTPHDQITVCIKRIIRWRLTNEHTNRAKSGGLFSKESMSWGKMQKRTFFLHAKKKCLNFYQKDICTKRLLGQTLHFNGNVRQHIHKIYEKLHVQNRTEALNKFYGKR